MLNQVSDHLLISIARYLTVRDWASIGAISHYFAYENKTIWTGLHSLQFYGIGEIIDDVSSGQIVQTNGNAKKKRQTLSITISSPSRRVTRSVSYPRVAFFNALRARVISYEQTALTVMNALRQSDALKLVESTLTTGFPVNRLYLCDQSSVLGICARFGRWKTAKHLVLHRGADLNQPDVYGMTPLLVAAWKGDLLGVKTLLSLGRQVYEKNERSDLRESAVQTTGGDGESNTTTSSSSSSSSSSHNSKGSGSSSIRGSIHGTSSSSSNSSSGSVLDLTVRAAPAMTSVCGSKVRTPTIAPWS